MKKVNLLLLLACFTIIVSSCKKDDDDKKEETPTPTTGTIDVSAASQPIPQDDYYYYSISGNITVQLRDSATNTHVLETKYINGSAGNVKFENVANNGYNVYAEIPYTKVRKTTGSTSTGKWTHSEDVIVNSNTTTVSLWLD